MPVYFIWHTQHDDRVCPICRAIDGYRFGPYDEVPDTLVHPEFGEVWNEHLGSLAHEHKLLSKNRAVVPTCRCHLEPKIDYSELLTLLRKRIQEMTGELTGPDDTKGGDRRKTTFEDIGVDPSKYGFE